MLKEELGFITGKGELNSENVMLDQSSVDNGKPTGCMHYRQGRPYIPYQEIT